MDETRLKQMMSQLDNDLFIKELDAVMSDLEIDLGSIAEKAHGKLGKEPMKMKKHSRRYIAVIVAAALVAVGGVVTVYASEISDFIRSLTGKTSVSGAVVEGDAFYLAEPIAIDGGQSVVSVVFTQEELDIKLAVMPDDQTQLGIAVEFDGKRHNQSDGMTIRGKDGSLTLVYTGLSPVSSFNLLYGGKSYLVQLVPGRLIVRMDGGDIVEAQAGSIPWITMGYAKTPEGIQILAVIDDPAVQLDSLCLPGNDTVKISFNQLESGGAKSNTDFGEPQPLVGYDRAGNTYSYRFATDDAYPQTVFASDAPADAAISLRIPGILVSTEESAILEVALPAVGEKREQAQEMEFHLQAMRLDSVERTSATTARLLFTLNTGGQQDMRIFRVLLYDEDITAYALVFENGACVLEATFAEDTTDLHLDFCYPSFVASGDWTLDIE